MQKQTYSLHERVKTVKGSHLLSGYFFHKAVNKVFFYVRTQYYPNYNTAQLRR